MMAHDDRDMMSEEARAEEDLVTWIGTMARFVIGFTIALAISLVVMAVIK